MRSVAVALALPLLSLSLSASCPLAHGQTQPTSLERQLLAAKPEDLAKQALEAGNPRRGAMLFYQQRLACARCHLPSGGLAPLGPDLTVHDASDPLTPVLLIESLLQPSKRIRKGYQPSLLQLDDGRRLRGIVLRETADSIELRDISRDGAVVRIKPDSVTARKLDEVSLMPEGLASQLTSQRQFFDLVKYLHEIVTGGSKRAEELAPPVAMRGIRPLPEYEGRVDHRGILASLDDGALRRGQEVYESLCVNCHGTHDRPGSLPTSLRFASGKFKRGGDPYSMYLTLTHGYGQMVAQTWMVPTQKYDVIHYIRERYLKSHNPDQYVPVGEAYLASLPVGDTRGPAPVKFEPWATMNYGHTLTHTYEVGDEGTNFAYKGVAVRLDPGPGGISRGRQWMVFDEDTMRWAAGWSGDQFIDWNGIMFNGRHNAHPRLSGRVEFQNPTGPGWSRPGASAIDLDDPRLRGRDQRPYGPLPRDWAKFRGLYHYGDRAVVSYRVGSTSVLEMPAAEPHPADNTASIFERVIQLGPRKQPLAMVVARVPRQGVLRQIPVNDKHSVAVVAAPANPATDVEPQPLVFDGQRYLQLDNAPEFKLTDHGYSLDARVKTKRGGVLFAKTADGPKWVPDGKAWFIRGGRLVFDIGWVGAVTGKTRVDDGRWHQLAMTCSAAGKIKLYVDGRLDGEGQLQPKGPDTGHVARIGFASPNFPSPTPLNGELSYLRIHARELSPEQVRSLAAPVEPDPAGNTADSSELLFNAAAVAGKLSGKVITVSETAAPATGSIAAAAVGMPGAQWTLTQSGDLLLHIPAGETTIRASLRIVSSAKLDWEALAKPLHAPREPLDLTPLTGGGPANWGSVVETLPQPGDDDGPYAVDVLTRPAANPWMARVRLTGFDFFADADEAAVCTWDGDVWRVTGIDRLEQGLQWRRIASGLFQPLGLKIVNGDIYVGCRDQIAILRDLNDDGETDLYETFNSDHQVTEHFHEFAMGLQRDAEGNFYYAKSARHALPALVPHHGTLLRVTPDGARTDILATGFRAANGVCLNPDGTFIVTDQEGHWNPKNRINWVRQGGFYGNMYGYHDVTNESDDAMEQPLCWITNAFDRSPAELLWVDSNQWGPLSGSLLNLSYGYGRIFVVPHETINGQTQGGMCQLPIPDTPTGLIRGRFHPRNGQLYACGMFAWAGSQQQPGGFYRVRYTGQTVHLPVGLEATARGMRITFSGPVNPSVAQEVARYQVSTWSLKRTKNYGSQHYDTKSLAVKSARVSGQGRIVELELEGMQPTWCMEIKYRLEGANGEPVDGVIHNTVHQLKQ